LDTENPRPFLILGCTALLSNESSSDEDFENNFFQRWACILAWIAFTFPDTEHARPFPVGILEELEELDDSEDFEELDDFEEFVLIEICSGCCFPSTLDVDGFAAVNRECGWCTQH
jgi:hypothetical protein